MTNDFISYESIKKWKDDQISNYQFDTYLLNQFHDQVMRKVFELAVEKVNRVNPPCRFAWFVMGSGGRFEQGIISDQDHGLVFENSDMKTNEYFLRLGAEVSYGLNVAGYPYCEGKVMSSNSLWCKSFQEWEEQLLAWMEEGSWESIRNLQIFYDARVLNGENCYVKGLKTFIHNYEINHPVLINRFMDNIMHIKNSIGPLGQIIVEDKGKYKGFIDLKHSAFIPYVNAIRLLAIKEGIQETSTLSRINSLMVMDKKQYEKELERYKSHFLSLLDYRVSLLKQVDSYADSHYLNVKELDKDEKNDIKQILKNGKKLHQFVIRLIVKDVE